MPRSRTLLCYAWILTAAVGCGDIAAAPAAGSDASVADSGASALRTQPDDAALRALLRPFAPESLPPAPADPTNVHADDERAVALGHALFFDTGYSGALLDGDNDGTEHTLGTRGQTGRVACASCHVPRAGFSDDRSLGGAISLAAGWGSRRTPSLLDVAQAKLLMWDGRRDSLFGQFFGPLEAAFEMNSSRLFLARHIVDHYRAPYEAIFGAMPAAATSLPKLAASDTGCKTLDSRTRPPSCTAARRGVPGDGAEYDGLSAEAKDVVTRVTVNAGKALGAYERRLNCGPSRVDAWVKGTDDALDASEKRGAALFAGKAHCDVCHSGPFFSDQKFHNVGLRGATVAVAFSTLNDPGASTGLAEALDDPLNVRSVYSDGDDGRLPESVPESMQGAFRTPTLRCVDMRPRFMHTGQLISLEEVVRFFSRGGDPGGYPGTNELKPLDLSSDEQADLVSFLHALRGPGPTAELAQPPAD